MPTSTGRTSTHVAGSGTDAVSVKSPTTGRKGARLDLRADDGTTLIELVVGMVIMSIFLGLFTTAIVSMNSAENHTEAVSLSTSQINQAFLTLDKTVRYATAITTPGTGTLGDWYVELRTTNTGSEVCTQLRIDTQQLQRRTWTVTNQVGSAPTAWLPLTSYVANGGAAAGAGQPFVLVPPINDTAFQQLKFNLSTLAGGGSAQTTSLSSFTFTAVNSTVPAPTGAICQQQGRP